MKRFFSLGYISILILVVGCTSNNVSYDSDFKPGTVFSDFKTFAWHAPNESNAATKKYIANDLVDQSIRRNVESQLAAKGFSESAQDKADFLVNYSITTEDKIDIDTYNTYNGYGPGWGFGGVYRSPYFYYGVGYSHFEPEIETRVSQYKVGTFVLDIINAEDGKLIWRGTAEGHLAKDKLSQDEREQKIAEVVGNVLKNFPPR